MKRRITTLFLMLSLVLSVWPLYTSRANNDGHTVVAWGINKGSYDLGQSTVPSEAQSGVVAIAGGGYHSLALKSDGTVVTWGANNNGQSTVPSGLSGVTVIAAGGYHSLALKSDGTVVAWGNFYLGQTDVPTEAQSGVTAIAAGYYHSLALKSDGTVVAWGYNSDGQIAVPSGLSGVTAIAAGAYHSLALKSDGTVVAWGRNTSGLSIVPTAAESGVTAIAGGGNHSLALKSDGTVVAWGDNSNGQSTVPTEAQSGVTAIAAGYYHSLALKSDGTVVAWGSIGADAGQSTVPTGLSGVTAIAAGDFHSLALGVINYAPTLTAASVTRTAGSPSANSQIATVNDAEDAANTLTVSATPATGSGVTVSGISVDANGNVTADVEATCAATTSTFTLTVTDSGTLFTETPLTVTVNANTPPTLTYASNPATTYGTALIIIPLTGPSDNCTVQSVSVNSVTPSNPGGITVNSAGVVSVPNTVPAGSYTVTVRAVDNCGGAGGTTDAKFTLTVRYNFSGFFQPVDNAPTVNTVNAGQAIPVKFSLGGNKGLSIFAAGFPTSQALACNTGSPTDAIEETVTAGASSLSYDATLDQYKYVWKTDAGWKGTCRKLVLKFNDGTTREALFQFK